MNNIHVLTYATHSDGLFEGLINNKYNIKINVLGMNTKWNNYYDKIKGINTFIQDKKDDDIIIYIDGFDSVINKNIDDNLVKIFKSFNCDLLFSKNPDPRNFIENYILNKKFRYKSKYIANTGLYMGYSKTLKELFNKVFELGLDDDQTAINICMEDFNYKIDINSVIFNNVQKNKYRRNEYFTSYPFSTFTQGKYKYTIKRVIRGIGENYSLFKHEIIVIFLILIALILYFSNIR